MNCFIVGITIIHLKVGLSLEDELMYSLAWVQFCQY